MYKIVLVYFCLENCIRINYVFVCVVKVKFVGFFGLLMLVYILFRIFYFICIELYYYFYKFLRKKLFVIFGFISEEEIWFNIF